MYSDEIVNLVMCATTTGDLVFTCLDGALYNADNCVVRVPEAATAESMLGL